MHYDIVKNSRKCFATGKPLNPGDEFYSVLVDTVTGLERRDFSAEAWTGPPAEAIGFWHGRLPNALARPKPVSTDGLWNLFEAWRNEDKPETTALRYVVGLMLVQRRALKLLGVETEGDGEVLLLGRPRSSETIRVADPRLSEDELRRLEAELPRLLETIDG